jgi:hypothetical protein|tara:strand:+ start:217 stop:360 length:144 start_codon:yes stop_codon:yes gene_type:complete
LRGALEVAVEGIGDGEKGGCFSSPNTRGREREMAARIVRVIDQFEEK